jgi:hypothetical protein
MLKEIIKGVCNWFARGTKSHHWTITAQKALFYIITWSYQFTTSKSLKGKLYENTWWTRISIRLCKHMYILAYKWNVTVIYRG